MREVGRMQEGGWERCPPLLHIFWRQLCRAPWRRWCKCNSSGHANKYAVAFATTTLYYCYQLWYECDTDYNYDYHDGDCSVYYCCYYNYY